jgi:hypothetical protein
MSLTPIHPGEILADELEEIGLSAKKGGHGPPFKPVLRHVGRFLDESPERL